MPQTLRIAKDLRNPSVADVLEAFSRAYEPSPFFVQFHLEEREIADMQVTGMEYESGSRGMFILKGYGKIKDQENPPRRYSGFYNANERKGNFSFEE